MEKIKFTRDQWGLVIGDILTIFIVVALGFRNHESLNSFFQRFAFTFLPWTFAWLLIAPKFKLFKLPTEKVNKQFGYIILAMLVASPLAAILRAAWLGSSALPLFVLILGLSSALGLMIWRFIYGRWLARSDH